MRDFYAYIGNSLAFFMADQQKRIEEIAWNVATNIHEHYGLTGPVMLMGEDPHHVWIIKVALTQLASELTNDREKLLEAGRKLIADNERLLAENYRLRNGLASEWRDIESAPKDGTWVLVGYDDMPKVMHVTQWIGAPHNCFRGSLKPTHWMPLPPPPQSYEHN